MVLYAVLSIAHLILHIMPFINHLKTQLQIHKVILKSIESYDDQLKYQSYLNEKTGKSAITC